MLATRRNESNVVTYPYSYPVVRIMGCSATNCYSRPPAKCSPICSQAARSQLLTNGRSRRRDRTSSLKATGRAVSVNQYTTPSEPYSYSNIYEVQARSLAPTSRGSSYSSGLDNSPAPLSLFQLYPWLPYRQPQGPCQISL